MNLNSLAVATISWARSPYEETVLTNSLTCLAQLGLLLFITDAGSEPAYVQALKRLPHATVLGPVKGLWPQTKTSLEAAAASGAEWIFYTEPDKMAFFANHLRPMLQQIAADEQAGVYLASRSAAGFATFPAFQQMTETTINRCCAELMGADLDYIYGPFLMHRRLLPYLQNIKSEWGWGWRPYAFLTAHRLGWRVQAYTGDFFCPEDQRNDDQKERIYRMKQMAQNMEGLAAAAIAVAV